MLENNDRRELLLGGTAVAAALASGETFAASEHYNHRGAPSNSGLIDSALDCVKKGIACSDHCIELVKQGDTSIADCLKTVTVMLPMCTALSKLASSKSRHLSSVAKVCIAVCEDCHEECKKHAEKHAECKACMESCAACIDECKKVAA